MATDVEGTLSRMPFFNLTNYALYTEMQPIVSKYQDLFKENNISQLLKRTIPEEITSSINCKYYDEDLFNFTFKEYCNHFSTFHINLQSSYKNLQLLKGTLINLNYNFKVITLTETGNRTNQQLENAFPGYQVYYSPPKTAKGGVAVLIHESYFENCTFLPELSSDNIDFESIWLKVNSGKEIYNIGSIYRHPNTDINEFESYLNRVLDKVNRSKETVVIQGDINIDLLKPNNHVTEKYLDIILPKNILPTISIPTRITERSTSLIDHICIYRPLKMLNNQINSGCLLVDVSDHLPVFMIMNTKLSKSVPTRKLIRIISDKNINIFNNKLLDVNWETLTSMNDCNTAFNNFHAKFFEIYNICFPLVPISRRKSKHKEWIDKGLRISIRYKNILYRKCLRHPNNACLLHRYKSYKNKINKLVKKSEVDFYTNKLKEEKSNIQTLWKTYSMLLGKNKSQSNHIDKLVYNNHAFHDNEGITNAFNHYFTNIGPSLVDTGTNDDTYANYLRDPQIQSMFLQTISRGELLAEMKLTNKKKSSGIDNIAPKVVAMCADNIITPLLHIYNLSFSTGVFPDKLKIAKTIPLYKKNSRFDPNNYRPISLLSIFSKLLERLMHKRLYSYLTKFNILFDRQFGFRHNHSTVMALIEIVDNIRENIDNGLSVLGIFLDLSKAFDMVNHNILLYKIQHYGIRGNIYKWFQTYLTNRSQVTFVNNTHSNPLTVKLGVPQGSVLGPLLYLLYVNDISHVLDHDDNSIRLFADDTNIFIVGNNINDIKCRAQTSLQLLYDWFSKNNLRLNIAKTCYTLFSKRIKDQNLFIQLEGSPIPQVDEVKYLGVLLDKDLSFSAHCHYVKSKLVKLTSVFYYISRFINIEDAKTIYFAYALPYIQYGIEVFGHSSQKNILILQSAQNKLLKILCKKTMYDSPRELHEQLNIFNIHELAVYFNCNFTYKMLNGMLPYIFHDYFTHVRDTNRRSHRNANNLLVPYFRTEFARKTTKCLAARLWNMLPINLRQVSTIELFKKSLKEYILSHNTQLRIV